MVGRSRIDRGAGPGACYACPSLMGMQLLSKSRRREGRYGGGFVLVRVDVHYVPEDAGQVSGLLTALQDNGLEVHQASGPPTVECPLAVLITPAMLTDGRGPAAEDLARHYREVVPVSLLPGAAPIFADLSQSLVAQSGVMECARRIATIAHYGGKAIVEWNALTYQAQKWQAEGSQALLPAEAIPDALALTHSGPAIESNRRGLVAEFVAASQAAVNRRRRIGASVLTATAAVLSAVLVFAVIQAISARQAQTRAQREGNAATANRLARSAIDLIGGNPDLPQLLVQQAALASVTPAVEEARARVDASTWPHSSFALGYRPLNVAGAAKSDRLAIADPHDQNIVIYERPGGKKINSFNYGQDDGALGGMGRLSPNGHRLATVSEMSGSLKVFDVDAGQPITATSSWARPADVLLLWLNDDHLLIGRDNQVLSVDPISGQSTPVAALGDGEIVENATLSPNGHFLVVTTGKSVAVVDTTTRATVRTVAGEIHSPAITDDGLEISGANFPVVVSVNLSQRDTEVHPTQLTGAVNSVVPVDGPYTLVTGADGTMSLMADGSLMMQTVRAHLSDRVQAARLGDGRVATVGTDGYLRVWSVPGPGVLGLPTPFGFVAERTRMPSTMGVHIAPRESARNQIRLADDDSVAVTVLPGYAWILSTTDFKSKTKRNFFAGLNTDVFLSRDGSRIGAVSAVRSQTFPYSAADRRWTVNGSHRMAGTRASSVHDIRMALALGGSGIAAVSDDGATVALADEYQVQTLHDPAFGSQQATFTVQRRPVALYADDQGHGCVLTADGYLRSSDHSENKMPWGGLAGGAQITFAAGEFTGVNDYTLVTDDGTLLAATSNKITELGSIGAGNGSFAIRTSPSGHLIGVIGERGVVVYDAGRHAVVFGEPAHGADGVTDVAFSRDEKSLYEVNALGAVHRADLSGGPQPGDSQKLPRELTTQEQSLFDLNAG